MDTSIYLYLYNVHNVYFFVFFFNIDTNAFAFLEYNYYLASFATVVNSRLKYNLIDLITD